MIIREMNLSDIERVRAIAVATWRDTYSRFIPDEIQDKVLQDAYSCFLGSFFLFEQTVQVS